jgi:phosphatidylglycerol:prolipoprotein diacylglycerol transferase
MYRTLFQIGSFKVPSFGVLVLVGFLAGLWFARRRASKFGYTPDQISDVAFWVLAAGILGARLAFILIELPFYLKHPSDILQLQFQGLTSFGGVILAALAILWQAKRLKTNALQLMDCLAPSFLIGHFFGRIGCLLNGCCYGGHCDLPWGIHVIEKPGLFHPAQIYDGLMNLAGFGMFLLFFNNRKLGKGQATGFVFIVYGAARFIYEFWRAGETSTTIANLPLTEAHVMALLLVVFGAVLWLKGAKVGLVSPETEAVP